MQLYRIVRSGPRCSYLRSITKENGMRKEEREGGHQQKIKKYREKQTNRERQPRKQEPGKPYKNAKRYDRKKKKASETEAT